MFCVFVSKHSQTHFTIRDLNLIPFFKVRTLVFRMQTIYLLKLVLFLMYLFIYVVHMMRRYQQEGKS